MRNYKLQIKNFLVICFALLTVTVHAEQLEMDVITVYGKESYRLRKEVFELLTPLRKEELVRMKLKKHVIEDVPAPAMPAVQVYDTNYPIRPAGDVPTVSVVRTGLLLYFLSRHPQIENIHLEFLQAEAEPQDFYLKRVLKDQYVELMLPEGFYRMIFHAEGMEPSAADSIVVRPGQISLALVPVEAIRAAPPPPPPAVEEKIETVPPPPPPLPEKQISVQIVPLSKRVPLPEAQPTMVARGRLTYKEKGLVGMQIRLYEKEVGFFDPYDPNVEAALLAVTVTDTFGNFEFPPIDNDDGFLEGTRDPVLVLSLENSSISIQKPFALSRSVPYRYVIYQKDNVHPDAGSLTVGEIAVSLYKERPVVLFQKVEHWARSISTPIRILYPSGSTIKLRSRQLEVPSGADFAAVTEYLTYLTP